MGPTLTRRRFVRIAAAVAGLAPAVAAGGPLPRAEEPRPVVWRGVTFGALTSITVRHPDRAAARRILLRAEAEIARLEAMFTLYRPDSHLVRLNRDGRLAEPPADFVRLLSQAAALGDLTGGAFDVSVQPLWELYAGCFLAGRPAPPSRDAVRRAVERVDYRAIEIEPAMVRLARPGMALTLNGIAQGYVTDRVAELLREEGLTDMLVDIGEIRALGSGGAGEPWRAAIRDPFAADRIVAELPLRDQALATSGPYGFRFDEHGRFHHIFDPRSGDCPQGHASASVFAPAASVADALATAFIVMPEAEVVAALRAAGATRALLVDRTGRTRLV
ncbi:MAG: FAD:protein FMN transferase, partial [Rhodospirillaceae bacterium]|nr:FAD:protein FMN transferase [Rhodospirillaceae bacterium]